MRRTLGKSPIWFITTNAMIDLHFFNRGLTRLSALLCVALHPAAMLNATTLTDLTVANDAFLSGSVNVGTLSDSTAGPGFRMSVTQPTIMVEQITFVPEEEREHIIWHDEYGMVYDGGYYNDIYGDVTVDHWVPDEGYYQSVGTGSYDGDGNEILEEQWVVTMAGYWTTTTEYQWISSEWVSDTTGYWGVVGSYSVAETETIPAHEVTELIPTIESPVVSFTGNRSGTVWRWENPQEAGGYRPLMVLSSGGLSFPTFFGNDWHRRSLINDREVVLSEVLATTVDNDRQAYGSTMTRDGLEVWGEEGGALRNTDRLLAPAMESSVKVDHHSVHLARSYTEGESRVTKVTRILPDHSEFGGTVNVHGVLRVRPAGDLTMGAYTNGPTP